MMENHTISVESSQHQLYSAIENICLTNYLNISYSLGPWMEYSYTLCMSWKYQENVWDIQRN